MHVHIIMNKYTHIYTYIHIYVYTYSYIYRGNIGPAIGDATTAVQRHHPDCRNHCVMAHTLISQVPIVNESCHTFECSWWDCRQLCNIHDWVMTRVNESCPTYEWVKSHIQTCHCTRTNESCHSYEWVMSHVQMSHVTRTNESRPNHLHEWVMSRANESCHEWNMSHIRMRQITDIYIFFWIYSCIYIYICIHICIYTYEYVR